MKTRLTSLLLACAGVSLAHADFNPVALTPGSYTFDIVVESNTVQALPYCINVTAGSGTNEGDNTYYEQGLYARAGQPGGNSGIPLHNTVFTNINNANMKFLMPPTYATNNTLMIDSSFNSGTLTFNTPTTATNLAILNCGGGGGLTISYTVTHADTTTESGTVSMLDWFNGGSTVAWGANGRITSGGGYNNYNSSSVNNNPPYLYANQITVSDASPVVSITFSGASGNHANVFAVSGRESGSSWTPIPLGGFNVRGIVPAAFPLTATMDQGTNTVNNGNLSTWYEQGYLTNALTTGLPPSGSTFNSLSQPTHHYQMGDYSANNAILIDAGHKLANITPAVPANAYAYALLTAGGNIGGNNVMTNVCILQHADGVNETNLFYAYDWFNNNQAGSLALKANGRVNMYSRTVNNVNNGYPYLFETYFALNDTDSPVTNIVLEYQTAPGGNSTTYAMAVSSSDVPVPPVITSGPLPAVQNLYVTQTATFSVLVAGTAPITNSWLVQNNGVYVPLTDGVTANGSIVTGSSSNILTISGLTLADATNYEFVAANSLLSVTSSPAVLNIIGTPTGVVPILGWKNIANATFVVGSSTTIYSSNDASSATLTLSDNGVNNAWSSGITGDGANRSLMNGYVDAGNTGGIDAVATFSGLSGSSYDVYIYCLSDTTKPSSGSDGLPNYSVNGTYYYAPVLGAGTPASTFTAGGVSVGGTGFNGFVPATTFSANDFTNDIPASAFGNYIKIANVSANGGTITIQAEGDNTSLRSPLNGIEIVSKSDNQAFGVNFLGNTTDSAGGPAVAPSIVSQTPIASTVINVLANHVITTAFSVIVDAASATPLYYQWYDGATPIPGATSASYVNVSSNSASIYCVVSNFVGTASSAPVSINIYAKPALTPYQSAIFAYNPVAYWPLTETSGTTAFDYAGTNDGIYTGTNILGQPGLPATPGIGANTSVGFDGVSAYVNIPVGNLNITGPITVITWIQPTAGNTGFQTPLGHSDSSYRLAMSNEKAHWADSGPDVVGSASIADGNWHQLVGVYDGTTQYLYVDGQQVGTPFASTPDGSTGNVWIGGAPDYAGARNFQGNIAQVAIIPSALTAVQVADIYGSLDTAPLVSITPANPTIYSGSSVTFTAKLSGTPATSVQWYYIDTLNNSNNIAGATNTTYTAVNVPSTASGYYYGVVAGNAYGTNSAATYLTVNDTAAFLSGDLSPLMSEAYVGAPVTYSINAQGSLPVYYQWMMDGNPVSGATNASYTAPVGCGTHTYSVVFTNVQSAGNLNSSSEATLQGDANPTNIVFNADGSWQLNNLGKGTVPTLAGDVLTLTDNSDNESSSAFYTTAQYVGSFTASFTYQGQGQADGAAFIIQNNQANSPFVGIYSLGGGGGGLGYYGISNSVALEFNLYTIPGIALGIDGSTYGQGGAAYQPTTPVNIASGNPINVTVNCANGVMAVSLQDMVTLAAYSTNYVLGSLTSILGGNLGYVGFSGGTGGSTSTQTISNFQFHSVIAPVALAVSPVTAGSLVVSWPAADSSYVLQTTSSLSAPSWIAGPIPVVVNGVNQVTVDVTGSSTAQFFRLVRVVCQ